MLLALKGNHKNMQPMSTSPGIVGQSLNSSSNNVNAPKKISEFELEGNKLKMAITEIISITEQLQSRLEGVMRSPSPQKENQLAEATMSSGIGSFIKEERMKIDGCINRITNILDRLEI